MEGFGSKYPTLRQARFPPRWESLIHGRIVRYRYHRDFTLELSLREAVFD